MFSFRVTEHNDEGLVEHYSLPTDHSRLFADYGSLGSIEKQLDGDCAAVILEPLNYETFQPAEPEFLERVASLCRRHGGLFRLGERRHRGIGSETRLGVEDYSNGAISPGCALPQRR